ncbi:MAG: UDP-N-acetylglucosamine 2-epimerase [Flavobacteriales bacterium]
MKICVVTGTRAEYGLLYWVMKTIQQDRSLELQIIATGMHLSPEFGLTYKLIEKDGFTISKKIEILLSSDTPVAISKSMGLAQISFAEAYEDLAPDLILVLGDRFEIFSAVSAAMISRIPVAHCHGGESTIGVMDESIRHSITKMSHLHFTSTEEYRKRVIQLGENPKSVFNVGALGIENINRLKLLEKPAFEKVLGLKLAARNVLVTFHPVTLEKKSVEYQFKNLLKALEEYRDMNIVFTKPNADTDGRIVISLIDEFVKQHPKTSVAFVSMGQLNYLSALKYVDVVIGNSSSGLIEAPSFKIPTVNIGDRQKGRIKAKSVIDCDPEYKSIVQAINQAFSPDFKKKVKKVINPYGEKNASKQIVEGIKKAKYEGILKKEFFDISF